MMKTFDLPTLDRAELTETQLIEMTAENFVLATNNVDKIAFGGTDKMVIVHGFGKKENKFGNFET